MCCLHKDHEFDGKDEIENCKNVLCVLCPWVDTKNMSSIERSYMIFRVVEIRCFSGNPLKRLAQEWELW